MDQAQRRSRIEAGGLDSRRGEEEEEEEDGER
jgi:hypothetical protein